MKGILYKENSLGRLVNHNTPHLLLRTDGTFTDPVTGEKLGFDNRKMGSGEGAQVYGWGVYVAVDDLRKYGNLHHRNIRFKEEIFDCSFIKYGQITNVPLRATRDEIRQYKLALTAGNIASHFDLYDCTEKEVKKYIESLIKEINVKISNLALVNSKTPSPSIFTKKEIDSNKQRLDDYNYLLKHIKVVGVRHHYDVEIPDYDGKNYLPWQKAPNKQQFDMISTVLTPTQANKIKKSWNGEDIYRYFVEIFKTPEKASKTLNKVGFIGVHYYGHTDGECYVIFDDKDAKIVRHELYGLQGIKKAADVPLKSVITITIEQIPTAYHSDKRPQGDYTPLYNRQSSSKPHLIGDLFGDKDIKKSINDLKKTIKNWNISDAKEFAYIISNNIGAEPSPDMQETAEEAESISYYLNLPQYSLRIGLHNINAENYKDVRNRPINHGVTLKDWTKKDTFKAKKGVKVKEYVYLYWTEERLKNIAKAILHLLETGDWDKTIAEPDYINPKTEKLSGTIAKNEQMQAKEVEIVLKARNIIRDYNHNPTYSNLPFSNIEKCYKDLVELYNNQPIITPKDGKAIALQQYSTPCPIAFLMGEFLKNNNKACYKNGYYITSDYLYYEPTAGNGMLAIALPHYLTWYNELDEIRFDNLEKNFSTIITKNDASVWKPDNQFAGVIMNPPFGSLTKSEYYTRKGIIDNHNVEYTFERLDYKIAINSLDCMRDDGKSAIIIGGKLAAKTNKDYKTTYWKNGKLFGQYRDFIAYLHRQYNIVDIIYISGDLYRKQGTTFPIVLILIDGRTLWNSDSKHVWHNYDKQLDRQINSFDELFYRISKHIKNQESELLNTELKLIKK